MRHKIAAVVAWLCFFAFQQVNASSADGIYTVLGTGAASCGDWLSNRPYDPGTSAFVASQRTVDISIEKSWVDGFVSAYNSKIWKGKNVASETDSQGMYAWIDTYCKAHPTEHLANATAELIEFLSKGPHPNDK